VERTTTRVAYIDWVRGFACLMMFQTHCYDSWLGGAARASGFFKLSNSAARFRRRCFSFSPVFLAHW